MDGTRIGRTAQDCGSGTHISHCFRRARPQFRGRTSHMQPTTREQHGDRFSPLHEPSRHVSTWRHTSDTAPHLARHTDATVKSHSVVSNLGLHPLLDRLPRPASCSSGARGPCVSAWVLCRAAAVVVVGLPRLAVARGWSTPTSHSRWCVRCSSQASEAWPSSAHGLFCSMPPRHARPSQASGLTALVRRDDACTLDACPWTCVARVARVACVGVCRVP